MSLSLRCSIYLLLLGKHTVLVLPVLRDVRYNYVSKLAINVLEEAFKLQEHLLALRRYHFMELADWADLFILSLWHHVFLNSDSEWFFYLVSLFESDYCLWILLVYSFFGLHEIAEVVCYRSKWETFRNSRSTWVVNSEVFLWTRHSQG